jgi:DeoR family transcriptional regulator of aga operon
VSHTPVDFRAPGAGTGRRVAQKVEHRCAVILNCLAGGEELAVEEVIALTSASPATVRRDLRRLERQGLVRRAHGVVALTESRGFEPFLDDPGFREQVHHMAAEKRRIGAAAAALVQDGETIAIAAGTTAAKMSRLLRPRRELTIVTNALNVAMDLSRQTQLTVHVTGGYLSGNWLALVGPKALEFVSAMFTDTFFFGANGVHPEHGVTDRHPEEAATNQALARQARKRVLLVDNTKFGHTAGYLVCRASELDMIITDTGASDELIAPFQRLGIEVVRV